MKLTGSLKHLRKKSISPLKDFQKTLNDENINNNESY
jgi:hypothetical protein